MLIPSSQSPPPPTKLSGVPEEKHARSPLGMHTQRGTLNPTKHAVHNTQHPLFTPNPYREILSHMAWAGHPRSSMGQGTVPLSSYLVTLTPSLDDRADLVPTAWTEAQHLCPGLLELLGPRHCWAVTGLLEAACLPSSHRQRARVSSLILRRAAQTAHPEPAPGLATAPLPSRDLPAAQECCNFRTPGGRAYSRDGPSSQQLAAAVALTGCRAQDTKNP